MIVKRKYKVLKLIEPIDIIIYYDNESITGKRKSYLIDNEIMKKIAKGKMKFQLELIDDYWEEME